MSANATAPAFALLAAAVLASPKVRAQEPPAPAPKEAAAESPSPVELPPPPPPPPAQPWALEVDLRGDWGFMVQPKVDHAGETSSRNGGPGVGVGVLFRPGYFLAPALDVSFQPLYRSQSVVDLGPTLGGPQPAEGTLRTLGVTAGAAFDVWRLRLGAGIGAYQMQVRSTLNGRTIRTSEWDMGYAFSLAGFLWESSRFRLGLETRLGVIVDGGTTFFSVGLLAAGDAFRW